MCKDERAPPPTPPGGSRSARHVLHHSASRPMTPTTIAMVEDDINAQERFARVMAADPTLNLIYTTRSGGELLQWFALHPVDVLLVDLGLPDIPGIRVIQSCAVQRPECSIMVVSIFGDEKNMLDAFEAGACGYLRSRRARPRPGAYPSSCAAGPASRPHGSGA